MCCSSNLAVNKCINWKTKFNFVSSLTFLLRTSSTFNQLENICVTFALTTFVSLRDNAGVEKVKWGHVTWFIGQPVRRFITLVS